ncbi:MULTISPECIES: alpha/beta fold hydrolase [unclassified Minwuia]|jgi:3-oxoadipate enol-lactonase|uniref:alpha/beta fold hydrolase n=1 Tax=unclassified Minwuia TaxID=2618799 RepID=UPI00247B113A|nr:MULTISPECIES: alpha/beta fold hydrolase [unclassified Minwuia]
MSTVPTFTDSGSGPAIIFLHGIGGNAGNWQPQIDILSSRYRCIAWNAPGYADSPALPDMTFPALADALARLMDHLGLERAVICGLSMGGYVAQEFLALHPERVRAAILMCTSAAFGKPGGDFQQKFLAARLKPMDEGKTPADIAPALVAGMVGPNAGPEVGRALTESMSMISPETYRQALNCLVTFDRRDAVKQIAVPTCLIAGEEDTTAPATVMERMAARIPGSRFHVIGGAGHIANLEAPEETCRLISGFMEGLPT